MSEHKKNLIVDIAALLIYAVVANPVLTGISLHEWLGLGVFVVFLVHVAMHTDWVIDTCKAAFKQPSFARTGNVILDVMILVVFMVCMVSGLLVSGDVLPALGFFAEGYYFWGPLHAASAKFLLALLLVHVAVHWRWIVLFFKKKGVGKDKCSK